MQTHFFRSTFGTGMFEFTAPKSITTWYLSVFEISNADGMNVANVTKIRVSQPFVINLELPHSIIKGEVITVPAAVLSHLKGKCISVSMIVINIFLLFYSSRCHLKEQGCHVSFFS